MPSAWARSVRSSQRRKRMPDSSAQLPVSMISSRRHSAADGFMYPSPKTSAPAPEPPLQHTVRLTVYPSSPKAQTYQMEPMHRSTPGADQATTPDLPRKALQVLLGISGCVHQRVHLLGRQPDASLDTCQARCCRRGRPERPSYCHGRSFSHAEDFWNSKSQGCLFKTFRNLGSCMQDTDRKAAQRQSSGLRMFGGR